MPVRVLLITQWFDPEPTPKGVAFAQELRRQGVDVQVLTGFPNYPTGTVYGGYRLRLRCREVIDGVPVLRVLLYPSHDRSVLLRALNYMSFALSALLFGFVEARRADVIYAYHPPVTVGLVAALIGRLRRRPVLLDVQDLWPDTLAATGMIGNRSVLDLIGMLCGWIYRGVDSIVVLSPGFRNRLIDRGVPASKVEVVYNWADNKALTGSTGRLPARFPCNDRFRIVFAGNMGSAQGLDSVLEAAVLLQARASRVTFVLVGEGIERKALVERAAALDLGNVIFLPAMPMSKIGVVLASADALLVHLRRDPLFEITIPSKIQAYMAVGRPVLAAVSGDAADLITRANCGRLAVPGDPKSIADAADQLAALQSDDLEALGANARRFYESELSLQKGCGRFIALLDRLCESRKAA